MKFVILLSLVISVTAFTPQLRRSVEKSGFHREISTSIYIHESLLPVLEGSREIICQLQFTEIIPSGAYVDPYQIASLRPFGGPDALIKTKVDIEKPEYLSEPLTVEIFTKLYHTAETWTSNYSLPVHLRYHATSDVEDFATVTFTRPEVALRCWNTATGLEHHGYIGKVIEEKQMACSSKSHLLCEWTVIETSAPCDVDFIVPSVSDDLKDSSLLCEQDSITVKVPVGRSSDYYLVTGVTLLFTVGGCLILGYYVINKDYTDSGKKLH